MEKDRAARKNIDNVEDIEPVAEKPKHSAFMKFFIAVIVLAVGIVGFKYYVKHTVREETEAKLQILKQGPPDEELKQYYDYALSLSGDPLLSAGMRAAVDTGDIRDIWTALTSCMVYEVRDVEILGLDEFRVSIWARNVNLTSIANSIIDDKKTQYDGLSFLERLEQGVSDLFNAGKTVIYGDTSEAIAGMIRNKADEIDRSPSSGELIAGTYTITVRKIDGKYVVIENDEFMNLILNCFGIYF
ncbi:MAG: hypothetical protein K5770_07090 [Lachnospiraceae bacterium]|nr:hypothetical protein [Lachnospiraceae bacterium]